MRSAKILVTPTFSNQGIVVTSFRIFKPGEDAAEIYRFRYKIYEEEMQRHDRYADHEKKIITDPLDNHGYNIAVYESGVITGSVRVNFCTDGDPGEYLDFYGLKDRGRDYPDKVSYSTRLMVEPAYRGGVLPLLISVECFKLGLERGVNWCICDCNSNVLPFFKKLGYEVQDAGKVHPSFGKVIVLRFNLRDPKHYDRKRSVFARYLEDSLHTT
jgi:N-acyl-L-homoserine lactone synthetase